MPAIVRYIKANAFGVYYSGYNDYIYNSSGTRWTSSTKVVTSGINYTGNAGDTIAAATLSLSYANSWYKPKAVFGSYIYGSSNSHDVTVNYYDGSSLKGTDTGSRTRKTRWTLSDSSTWVSSKGATIVASGSFPAIKIPTDASSGWAKDQIVNDTKNTRIYAKATGKTWVWGAFSIKLKTASELNLTNAGYKLDKWTVTFSDGDTAEYSPGDTFTSSAGTNSSDLTSYSFYAKWAPETYTVTFNKQGGTGGSDNVSATYGSAMPSATMPTKTGYVFAGYYDATSEGTQYYTATGASARTWNKASTAILYARWTPIAYNIQYQLNNGSGPSPKPSSGTFDSVVNIGNPTRTGYTFAGWTYSGGNTSTAKYGSTEGAVNTSWSNVCIAW